MHTHPHIIIIIIGLEKKNNNVFNSRFGNYPENQLPLFLNLTISLIYDA